MHAYNGTRLLFRGLFYIHTGISYQVHSIIGEPLFFGFDVRGRVYLHELRVQPLGIGNCLRSVWAFPSLLLFYRAETQCIACCVIRLRLTKTVRNDKYSSN